MNDRRNSSISPQGAGAGNGTLTELCSISDTGLVFHSQQALVTGAEVGLTVQTSLMGRKREWSVQGWVVECQPKKAKNDENGNEAAAGFEVTLLFSDLPQGLKVLLGQVRGSRFYLYPPVKDEESFGLN